MRYLELPGVPALSRIGLGTWQFGSREWGHGEAYASAEAGQIVRRALELGITLIDTAEIYGFGRSERIVGAALGSDRDRAFLATKIFPVFPVAAVVRRLDLYQVHQPNPLVRDRPTMRGMRALQDTGVVGEVGVSNYSLERWRTAETALGRGVLSNQVSYSLTDSHAELDLVPFTAGKCRLVIAYSPLARGFSQRDTTHSLAALYRSMRFRVGRGVFGSGRRFARGSGRTSCSHSVTRQRGAVEGLLHWAGVVGPWAGWYQTERLLDARPAVADAGPPTTK